MILGLAAPTSNARRPVAITKVTRRRFFLPLSQTNLTLRDALRLQTVRDPLTGLYNHRYMHEFPEREIQCARRRQHPVSLMMLDLDNFKRYNDTFGHSAGDEALPIVESAI